MFATNCAPSLADIAAVTGNNRNSDGFMDGNGWWVLIILFALFGGWGNGNGWGGNSGGGGVPPYVSSEIQRGFDTSNIIDKLDGINYGLCDGFYAQNTNMLNGFASVQNAMCQGFNGLNTAIMQGTNTIQQDINAVNIANMQNANALQRQLADCCCENRAAIAQVRYDMATDTCAIQNTIQNTTRDLLDNQNANTRAILDFLTTDKIATLQAENQNLKLAASQAAQNNYLIDQLKPCPVPAYITCNPYTSAYGFGNNYSGYNNCGCNTCC